MKLGLLQTLKKLNSLFSIFAVCLISGEELREAKEKEADKKDQLQSFLKMMQIYNKQDSEGMFSSARKLKDLITDEGSGAVQS